MSLADQSQQWYPTSVQVTVFQARNLRTKGKNGTNDAYAIMQMAKDKFSTSVAEKCVAPEWKEEATFDLPLFHQDNASRCTLHVLIMHRAQVGLDKFLGQAVINLLDLHNNTSRQKTEWFKLVDKNGKEDKVRGEVLLDIKFMRNNMSASMFDLSAQDKPRSRIGKLKDKVRGKKKDGFSDSASAIVPSVSKGQTDSDGEGDGGSDSPGVKKKSKLKLLFAPKSNLHRNTSQSMSTLGTLPEKNSSLSSSRSSGLNTESPDAKKKFKFLGHKRTDSNDSKISLGAFSLLGRSKHNVAEPNSLCINGSHVYEEDSKTASNLSLNTSDKGSVEDVRRPTADVSVNLLRGEQSVPSYRAEPQSKALLEPQNNQEEEKRKPEERRKAEARKLQEEERERQEQESTRRKLQEQEMRRQEEEEQKRIEERNRAEEGQKRQEEAKRAEEQKRQEEAKRAEEQKRQEEASVSNRLTSLFGMIMKKEEAPQPSPANSVQEKPKPAPRLSKDLGAPAPQQSTKTFEEISLSPDLPNPGEVSLGPQTPSGVFSGRTVKVSAVKPRPHPVKPMSSTESLMLSNTTTAKEIKTYDPALEKRKVTGVVESGPYTQLTQEELITLVVKQQTELSKKEAKIVELEEYIDNLLVRVIDEQPNILLSLNAKPAL